MQPRLLCERLKTSDHAKRWKLRLYSACLEHEANPPNGELLLELVHSRTSTYVTYLFVAVYCQQAQRYWIPRVEETPFSSVHGCKNCVGVIVCFSGGVQRRVANA